MNEMAAISEYCERLDPGLWAEPANFISNAGFLLAACAAWRQAGACGQLGDRQVRWLLFWLTAIGIGSGLFHSLATPWAKACDVAPIGIFVLLFYGLWLRQILRCTRVQVAAAYLLLAGLTVLCLYLCRDPVFAGSQGYFGVALLLPVLGFDQRRRFAGHAPKLLYAAIAFAAALVCRTMDRPICPTFPVGSHWLWHLLNAFVCWSAMTAMLDAKARRLALN